MGAWALCSLFRIRPQRRAGATTSGPSSVPGSRFGRVGPARAPGPALRLGENAGVDVALRAPYCHQRLRGGSHVSWCEVCLLHRSRGRLRVADAFGDDGYAFEECQQTSQAHPPTWATGPRPYLDEGRLYAAGPTGATKEYLGLPSPWAGAAARHWCGGLRTRPQGGL
eukprot:6475522-Pyramimonas_sp.AAC.1